MTPQLWSLCECACGGLFTPLPTRQRRYCNPRVLVSIRRLIWTIVVIGAVVQITYQVYDRIAYFAIFPSNVNIKVIESISVRNHASMVEMLSNEDIKNTNKTRANHSSFYGLVTKMRITIMEWTSNQLTFLKFALKKLLSSKRRPFQRRLHVQLVSIEIRYWAFCF